MSTDILTIYEVRRNIREANELLKIVNSHIHDNSVDTFDYDNLRVAYQLLAETFSARWTNQIL